MNPFQINAEHELTALCGITGHGMMWQSRARYGMAWHGMAWYGKVWYGIPSQSSVCQRFPMNAGAHETVF